MAERSNARCAGLVVALAATLAAGCGSGQDALERWRIRADNACLDARAAIGRLGPVDDFAGLEHVARGAAPPARTAIGRLRDLNPPESVRDASTATISALSAQLPLLNRLAAAAERHDRRAVARLSVKGRALERRVTAAARRAGLEQCGSHGVTPGG